MRETFLDELLKTCNCGNVPIGDSALTLMRMKTYSIIPENANYMSEYIYEVLEAVYDFMDKMNYVPTNNTEDIKCNTIIAWKKREYLLAI